MAARTNNFFMISRDWMRTWSENSAALAKHWNSKFRAGGREAPVKTHPQNGTPVALNEISAGSRNEKFQKASEKVSKNLAPELEIERGVAIMTSAQKGLGGLLF
jgi:hypothetical protein